MIVQRLLTVPVWASSTGGLHLALACAGRAPEALKLEAVVLVDDAWPDRLVAAAETLASAAAIASLAVVTPDWAERVCHRCADGWTPRSVWTQPELPRVD